MKSSYYQAKSLFFSITTSTISCLQTVANFPQTAAAPPQTESAMPCNGCTHIATTPCVKNTMYTSTQNHCREASAHELQGIVLCSATTKRTQ